MIKEVDGKISGDIQGTVKAVSGNVISSMSMSGNVNPAGQKIVYDAEWGSITGDIDRQEDLQVELHDRDNTALSVQEIEKILYLN